MRTLVPSLLGLSLLAACNDPGSTMCPPSHDDAGVVSEPGEPGLAIRTLVSDGEVRDYRPTLLPVAVERVGGLVGPVSVTVEGSFLIRATPLVIPNGIDVAMLELHAAPGGQGSTETITLRAIGDGGVTATTTTEIDFVGVPGHIEHDFGTAGVVSGQTSTISRWSRIVVRPDGSMVVAGSRDQAFVIARFLPNGSPDTSFDLDGEVVRTFGPVTHQVNFLTVADDGTIDVGGWTGGQNGVVLRYRPTGAPDSGLDGDGELVTTPEPIAYLRLPDGRIRYAAYVSQVTHVFGLLANGMPDASFHGGTPYVYDAAANGPTAMLRRADGTLLVGGTQAGEPESGFVLALDDVGEPVDGFGTDGVATATRNSDAFQLVSMALLPDERVALGGPGYVAAISRDGHQIDFGEDGVHGSPSDVTAMAVGENRFYTLSSSGRIESLFFDGIVDESFGTNGVAQFVPPSGTLYAFGLGLTDDTLLAVGTYGTIGATTTSWMAARLR